MRVRSSSARILLNLKVEIEDRVKKNKRRADIRELVGGAAGCVMCV